MFLRFSKGLARARASQGYSVELSGRSREPREEPEGRPGGPGRDQRSGGGRRTPLAV